MKYIFTLLLALGCSFIDKKIYSIYSDFFLVSLDWEKLLDDSKNKKLFSSYRSQEVSALVLHHTDTKNLKEYLQASLLSNFSIHLGIDKSGNVYGFSNPFLVVTHTVPKMDAVSIHIALEGSEEEILSNLTQLKKAGEVVDKISQKANIPKSNQDIASLRGIFTHSQAKKKFGNFIDLNECGSERVLKTIFLLIGGSYYPEEEWQGRYERSWVARKEKNNLLKQKASFDRGRGITSAPKLELEVLEQTTNHTTPEPFRLQYKFQKKIQPTCIVLHFTAISSFQRSLEVLEARGLSATIMVDKDGKAYQILDYLDDMAQAATGTNEDCIQIEIVGKNTDELLANPIQIEKVKTLVLELSKKYNIPLTNYKIEGLRGVFSHTQAKKKFGGSVALVGKDFDPGEPYMKLILESIGGKYYEEKDWFERSSSNWIILDTDFQP